MPIRIIHSLLLTAICISSLLSGYRLANPATIGIVFNNSEWIIEKLDAPIPEAPFEVRVNGHPAGTTKLLTFANRVPNTSQFPQVFVINSSGYLRIKAGADPSPSLPFGQSLVLGPAVFGTSTSFPTTTLFFNPQLQAVNIDTLQLNPDGTGNLRIQVTANDINLAPDSTKTNQIMNQTWEIILHEPTHKQTRIDVAGTFTFTENVVPDPTRTAELQSFRLLQISSMFIDSARHDVDAFRFSDASGLVTLFYDHNLVNTLLPPTPSALDPAIGILESLHTDDIGQPNGNTPSYQILMGATTGPVSRPITPRAFFNASQDINDDNLALWLHQQPLPLITQGTSGSIDYTVLATADPVTPQPPCALNCETSFAPVCSGPGWGAVGGLTPSAPHASVDATGRVLLFARGVDNGIWQNIDVGLGFQGWSPVGGLTESGLASVVDATNRVRLFARRIDNGIWQNINAGAGFQGWTPVGGLTPSALSTVLDAENCVRLFARGIDNGIWQNKDCSSGFTGWTPLGGLTPSALSAVINTAGYIHLFARGIDDGIWQNIDTGSGFTGWTPLGGLTHTPLASVLDDNDDLHLFARGLDQRVWENVLPSGASCGWTGWQPIRAGGLTPSAPAAISDVSGVVRLFAQGVDSGIYEIDSQ